MFQPLSAFLSSPESLTSVSFETQRRDEKIHILLRRHFITNASWILSTVVGLLIPPLFTFLKKSIFMVLAIDHIPPALTPLFWTTVCLIYYVLILYYAFLKFTEWFFNALIVTNLRVIDINFVLPFQRQTTQTQLEEVQDISETQHGIFSTIFNFGNIYIQTAGTKQNIFLTRVPHPRQVHDLIINLINHSNHHV